MKTICRYTFYPVVILWVLCFGLAIVSMVA